VGWGAKWQMFRALMTKSFPLFRALQRGALLLSFLPAFFACGAGPEGPIGQAPSGGSSTGAQSAGGAPAGGSMSASGGETTSPSGGSESGGAPGAGGETPNGSGGVSESGGAPSFEGRFELLFRDDFESLDSSRWQLMTHSWDTNIALFSSESATVENGQLTITLLEAPPGTTDGTSEKQFLGAEVRSVDAITYGRVVARAKLARGSAVVSSLVTIYTPWPADNWNELDIESLGKNPEEIQFNAMVYTGTLPATKTPVSPTQDPKKYSLGFDASADFHEYTIEWTPESARFLVDGVLAHEWTSRIELMNLPQNILLTIWASSSAAWAGPVNETTLGAQAVYDWVEVYEYK